MIKTLTAWSIAIGVAVAPVTGSTIERLAPENSMLVVSVDNFSEAVDKLKGTPLWGLWTSEQIRGLLAEPLNEFNDELDEALQDLDVDRESLVGPQGPVGFAVFPGNPRDEVPTPGFLAMADYGDETHKINRVVDALIARAEEEGGEPLPEQDVLGRTVYTINLAEMAGEDAAEWADREMEDEFGGMDGMGGMGGMAGGLPDADDVVDQLREVYFVRDGRRFMLSSRLDVVRDALEIVDEEGQSGLATRQDFQETKARLGDVDGYALVMLGDILGAVAGGDPMMMMMMGMIQSLIGDITAVGLGVTFPGDEVMVEETFVIQMPHGKEGLTKLLQIETPQGRPPGFVGPDVVAYSRTNFDFNGVLGFLRGVAAANPMLGAELNQWLLEQGPTIEQVCAAMGPEVHSVVTLARPIQMDSMKTLYAIESSEPAKVEEVLAQHAAGMGLQPRDFVGNRIYELPFDPMAMAGGGMMAPGGETFSIGFGRGFIMAGQTSLVEDALRAGGAGELGENPGYRQALGAMRAPRSVSWGVMDLVQYAAYFMKVDLMAKELEIEQFRQWDPEYAAELERELEEMAAEPWRDFDVNELNEYMGPVTWEIRATDSGFEGRYLVLAPGEE